MRTLLLLAILASPASAQSVWQINAAYQNQINVAQQSAAMPYYYAPVRPLYVAPRYRYYGNDLYRSQSLWEMQRQTRALRSIDNSLQNIDFDLMRR